VSLIVWNRSTDKCNEFVAAGAQQASSPAQALSLGGPNAIIMSCLFDDAGLFQTFDAEFLSALLPGQVHVCCATVAPATARTFASLHQERGAIWVSAPVFGRPPAVEAKLLHVVVSGADVALLQRLTPFLLAFSQKVHDFGCRDVAAANIVKLCGLFSW
jgi:3-hydroxyisobutyrate dehydrogenase-like beta-hydroxyacid dehydrogenase